MPIRAFTHVPKTLREWDNYLREVPVIPDPGSVDAEQLKPNSVTDTKLRDSEGCSVVGRAVNTSGDPGDIQATSDDRILIRRAGTLQFTILTDADIPDTIARDDEVTNALGAYATAVSVASGIADAITDHEAAVDPHPGYLTPAEGNAAYQPLTAALGLIFSGTGDPEGNVTAGVGSMFLRTDGGAGSTLYVKESGAGNTGWAAK